MYLTDGGRVYRLDLKTPQGWVVRKVDTNETKVATTSSLIFAIQNGELAVLDDPGGTCTASSGGLASVQLAASITSEAALQVFLDKKRVIDALRAEGVTDIRDTVWVRSIKNRLEKTTLSGVRKYAISTLQKTLAAVRKADGDWTQAAPRFSDRGGRGIARIDHRAEKIVQSVLDGEQDKHGPLVLTHIIDTVRARVFEHNLSALDDAIQLPGASTIRRRIAKQFTAYELCARNSGRESANKRFRENSYSRDCAQFPLEVSEYDDLDCGVFLINERNGLPVGRAFLTHGVCQCTRVPLGFDLGHQARNYESAMGAICSSLLPKDPSLAEFGELAHAWIGFGVQGTILMDNARYNHSQSTAAAADIAKLTLAGARPYGPTEKCSIEHYNDRVKTDFCSSLPGWRGDKSDSDSVKHGVCNSCIDIVYFRSLYVKWVTGIYLNDPGEDGHTPKQRWDKHFKAHGPAVRWSAAQIALLRLRPMELRFRASGGIKRLGLVYNSELLMTLRRAIGETAIVLVFVDNNDLSHVLVRHPHTFELLRADFTGAPRYVDGLTAFQQQLILKINREKGIRNIGIVQMDRAREELKHLVEQARRSHKLLTRRWAERVGEVPNTSLSLNVKVISDLPTSEEAQKSERVMTELEWSIVQLEQVNLSSADAEW